MDLAELDEVRAQNMRRLLNEEGRGEIWKYDVMRRPDALREAICNQSYDNIVADSDKTKAYCLVGPGIEDSPFNTAEELVALVEWLCGSYLGCYRAVIS